jgi:ABC-type sugar transport system permease subunit
MSIAETEISGPDRRIPWLTRLWWERPAIRGYTLLSPTLVLMVFALISPFLLLIGRSFVIETGAPDDWILSLGNYQTFFEKSQYLRVLWRSRFCWPIPPPISSPFTCGATRWFG